MTRSDVDDRLRRVATDQHGAFTRAQALSAGASSDLVSRRVRSGHWVRAASGVYLLAGTAPTWQQRFKAAELSVAGSAVSGRSALLLHGIPGGRAEDIELTTPAAGPRRSSLAQVHRGDVRSTRVEGIRVVTPDQAVIDVAGRARLGELERLVDHVLVNGLAPVRRFRSRTAPGAPRFPGIALLRAVIAERAAGLAAPESELERHLYRVLDRARVPGLVRQAAPPWDPTSRRRFDALSNVWATIYEADGRRWHARMQDMERDRQRDQEAAAHGFLTIRFTWTHLTAAAEEAVEIVRSAGAARAAA